MPELKMIDRSFVQPVRNVRERAEEEKMQALRQDIAQRGILVPLLVTENGSGIFAIVDGHCRYQIAEELGIFDLPCYVRELMSEEEFDEWQLSVNLHRSDLNPFDVAEVLKRMLDRGLSQTEVARRVNMSQPTVSRLFTVNKMPPVWRQASYSRVISQGALYKIAAAWDSLAAQDRGNLNLLASQLGKGIDEAGLLKALATMGEQGQASKPRRGRKAQAVDPLAAWRQFIMQESAKLANLYDKSGIEVSRRSEFRGEWFEIRITRVVGVEPVCDEPAPDDFDPFADVTDDSPNDA